MNQVYLGKVIAKSSLKTARISIVFHQRNKKYNKVIKLTKEILSHYNASDYDPVIGETVLIRRSRPYSKNKCFLVVGKKD